jgi:hypothetical protein
MTDNENRPVGIRLGGALSQVGVRLVVYFLVTEGLDVGDQIVDLLIT